MQKSTIGNRTGLIRNISIIQFAAYFQKYFQIESPLLNETGCYIQEHPIIDKSRKEYLDVLWVGKWISENN